MQRYNRLSNAIQRQQPINRMMNQQARMSMPIPGIQHRVSMQAQEFTTVSNLMKTSRDSELTAVNNIKS